MLFLNSLTALSIEKEKNITGFWVGEITLPTISLELVFKISEDDMGGYSTKLDVPAQGAKDLGSEITKLSGDSITILVSELNRNFVGKFLNDSTIEGNWVRNKINIPLTLHKKDKMPELNRPQTPKPPFSYHIEEVEYMNLKSGFKLAGTLTIPKNAKSCPAAVMITGSGAQDRDATIFEHKLFWIIADYFANNGIAILRVDDRGVGGSEGILREATSKDFAEDALTGIQFLKTKDEIDPNKLGLIGHSEGGLIAPIAATTSDDVSWFIMMAGPGMIGEQILYEQNDLALRAAGMPESVVKQNRQLQEALFTIIKTETDSLKKLDRLQRTLTGGMYPGMNEEMKKAIDTKVDGINSPWFKYFLTYDPQPTLQQVKCPVLAINGAKDVQVPATSNLEAIKKAITEGGNQKVKTIEFENLNHLFQNCTTGAVSEYASIENTIDPKVLEIMKDWIIKTNSN